MNRTPPSKPLHQMTIEELTTYRQVLEQERDHILRQMKWAVAALTVVAGLLVFAMLVFPPHTRGMP